MSTMAGYAFAKFHFRGEKGLFGIVMSTLLIPMQIASGWLYYGNALVASK